MSSDDSSISSTLPPRIGHYRVTGMLGRGAMGVVYLGHDAAIDRKVAIKTIHRRLLHGEDGAEWLARFRREVQAAGRCLHHNIVTVFEYGEEEGVPFIVMEYVEGRELRDYLREHKPMPLTNTIAVIVQVLQALDHAHCGGVVHRDIKPANIILLADGQVKVTDFGIARLETGGNMTQHGMAVGTPAYMAPEQFLGQEADRRADLYATGVVLFESLTGARPFAGRGAGELMYQILNEVPRCATEVNPLLPTELDAVLNKALARSPDARFQQASEFIAALETLRFAGRESAADGSTVIRVAPVRAPQAPENTVPGWDPVLLMQAEQYLMEFLGPVARLMVRKAAQQVTSPAELVQQLAMTVSNEHDRLLFQRRMRAAGGGTVTGMMTEQSSAIIGSQSSTSPGSFDQAMLEMARQNLAIYVGPIAKVLVRQAASKAKTLQELYERLAENIPNITERNAFLKRVPSEKSD